MNAEGIVIENAILGNIIGTGNGGALLVASAAHERNFEFGDPGIRGLSFDNIVRTMAIPAFWGQLFAAPGSQTVEAFVILTFDCLVALSAVNGREG